MSFSIHNATKQVNFLNAEGVVKVANSADKWLPVHSSYRARILQIDNSKLSYL